MTHFAIRTIKNGRVKIQDKWFRPSNKFTEYDGRLDGLRYVFGLYHDYSNGELEFISLWGSEQFYKTGKVVDWEGPECVNGELPWTWWSEVDES